MGKAVNELLEGSLRVSSNGGVISEEHLPDKDFAHLCLGSEAYQVEQATVASLFQFTEGVTQQQGEQDAKKCRHEDAPLFDAAFDAEGVRGGAIVLDGAFHFLVEGSDHPQELGGHPILCRSVNRPDLLTRSNALVRCIKAMYRGRLCSRHFSCSCLGENISELETCTVLLGTRALLVSAVYSA